MACYYLGGLFASFTFIFYLRKNYSYLTIGIVVASLNYLLAVICFFLKNSPKRFFLLIITLFLCFLSYPTLLKIEQTQKKNSYYNHLSWSHSVGKSIQWLGPLSLEKFWIISDKIPKITTLRSPYQELDLVQEIRHRSKDLFVDLDLSSSDFSLYLNGRFQFNTKYESSYHEYLAHVPIMLQNKEIPQSILILGAGDGFLAREILKHSAVKEITLIDLDPLMTYIAQVEPLVEKNLYSLKNEKIKIVHTDAFTWLRSNKNTYDAIYIDFPFPFSQDILRLYSYEFYIFIQRSLKENGFVVLDAPYRFLQSNDLEINSTLRETIYASGLYNLTIYKSGSESFIFARKKISKVHLSFVDYGIYLKSLKKRNGLRIKRI